MKLADAVVMDAHELLETQLDEVTSSASIRVSLSMRPLRSSKCSNHSERTRIRNLKQGSRQRKLPGRRMMNCMEYSLKG